eukprot:403372523
MMEERKISIQIANSAQIKRQSDDILQNYSHKAGGNQNSQAFDSLGLSAPQKFLLKRKIEMDKSEILQQKLDHDKQRQRMREVFRKMLFARYRVDGKDDDIYLTEDSEYEPDDAVKLQNAKIIYEVVANKREIVKYLIGQKLIKTENIEKFNEIVEKAGDSIESLVPLDLFITANKDIEFFVSKYIERNGMQKRKENEAELKRKAKLMKQKRKEAQYSRFQILRERSLYSKDYLQIGDIAEKDPLYAIVDPEDDNLRRYYSEIAIDGETFAKLNVPSKAFIVKFIQENYQKTALNLSKKPHERKLKPLFSRSDTKQSITDFNSQRNDISFSATSTPMSRKNNTTPKAIKETPLRRRNGILPTPSEFHEKLNSAKIGNQTPVQSNKNADNHILNLEWKSEEVNQKEDEEANFNGLLNQDYFKPMYINQNEEKKQIYQWMYYLETSSFGINKSPEDKRKVKIIKQKLVDKIEKKNFTSAIDLKRRKSIFSTPTVKQNPENLILMNLNKEKIPKKANVLIDDREN